MQVVIIGNGIAGSTAARFIRKQSNHSVLMISDESELFFSRTALMYVYMGHLRPEDTQPYDAVFWKKNNIQLLKAKVVGLDFASKKIAIASGEQIQYDVLIIASGSVPKPFDVEGSQLEGVSGLYHWQDLQYIASLSAGLKRAVVVGGGLIGVELAEMFHSRNVAVTFLIRESAYWKNVLPNEESELVSRHLLEHKIDCRFNTTLHRIMDGGSGRCSAVETDGGEVIETGFVGLTAGVVPNIAVFKETGLDLHRGILVDHFLRTNMPDVYAIGDCSELRYPENGRRSIEAIWYVGRKMGETVAATITGNPTSYKPGTWFNSAKFFDLEYQVYGTINPSLQEGEETVFWTDGKTKSIRINYRVSDLAVIGFNLIGVRYRQDVCTQWIEAGTDIEEVLAQLSLANFDPEFTPGVERSLIDVYNKKSNRQIRLKSSRSLSAVRAYFKK